MRIPVSAPQNIFYNGQNISDEDLTLEQNFNNQIETGIINNHFGSGILPNSLGQTILFDSNLATGLLDGKPINTQAQPVDNQLGNQLAVTLSGSEAAGTRAVKVLVVGLNFEQNLQYDTFTFHTNETQITSRHYTSILTILFNDFVGTAAQSFNLGGRIVIADAAPITLSRDCIMAAQDVQPNLFFRDFFVASNGTLNSLLISALPNYNINNLNISTGYLQLASIVENDVSSQIGQKFLATTNNIQKITLLLSVGASVATPTNFIWTGDILVSVYPLQSTVSCSTDITPQLAIEYDPSGVPLAQLSFNYSSLLANGILLNTVPQPVDFVFSNTLLGAGSAIVPGNYYVVTVKRAGSANNCQIQLAVGTNSSSTMWEAVFNGNIWTDIPSQSLWFQVWTDAAKISDGQAYDAGHGVVVPKTDLNSLTGSTQDYVLNQLPFNGNETFYALLQATTEQSTPVQDERTGNSINSEQQFVPSVSLLNINGLNSIQNVSDPLVIGTICDQNVKIYSAYSANLAAAFHEYGMVNNELVIKVITNMQDGYRYDENIIELVSAIVEGNINGAMFVPNSSNQNLFYRVAKAELITMTYGDVDGNGVIDTNDLLLAQQLLGANLNVFPTYNQYIVNTTLFIADSMLSWQILNANNVVVASGTHGIITPNPTNGALANFQDATANFNSITDLGGDTITISGSTASAGNNGTFTIASLIDNIDITIQKTFYNSETILQIMRGDIDGNMILSQTDYNYISNYIEAVPPFPATSSPANLVGTTFQAIRLTLEEYVDRVDDYPSTTSNRASALHPLPDIFLDGYAAFAGVNAETVKNPSSSNGYGISFNLVEQLVWEDYAVLTSPNTPREVACSFTSQSGAPTLSNLNPGKETDVAYPQPPPFDAGKNDFFVPDNLIINSHGQILRPDGYFMKLDFEIGTVILEVPPIAFTQEYSLNILTSFVADTGAGYTLLGYPAMRFADGTTVLMNALILNQIRFAVAVQSFSPQINGLDPACLSGNIIDGQMGVAIDYSTGLLTLNFANLYQDPVLQTLNTKVEITVYLKKAGWNNTPIFVNSTKTQNILTIPTPADGYVSCPSPPMMVAY